MRGATCTVTCKLSTYDHPRHGKRETGFAARNLACFRLLPVCVKQTDVSKERRKTETVPARFRSCVPIVSAVMLAVDGKLLCLACACKVLETHHKCLAI